MYPQQSSSMASLLLCQESWWTQLNLQLQLFWRICGGRLLLAFPRGPYLLLFHHLVLYSVLWRPTTSLSIGEHLGRPCRRCMTVRTAWRPGLQRCSSCSWGAAWSGSRWTGSSLACPQSSFRRPHCDVAILLYSLQNLSLWPSFWWAPYSR